MSTDEETDVREDGPASGEGDENAASSPEDGGESSPTDVGEPSQPEDAGQSSPTDAGLPDPPDPPDPPGQPDPGAGRSAEGSRATLEVPTEDDMRAFGRRLASVLRPGDLIVLAGKLGAGKTTLVQGIGAGLGVDRAVTSPTFVIARVHTPLGGGLPLVHADAYRLDSIAEIDDLDLDTPAEEAVTVVEWGEGLVEDLAEDRLEIEISLGDDDLRVVSLVGVGKRWTRVFA